MDKTVKVGDRSTKAVFLQEALFFSQFILSSGGGRAVFILAIRFFYLTYSRD